MDVQLKRDVLLLYVHKQTCNILSYVYKQKVSVWYPQL